MIQKKSVIEITEKRKKLDYASSFQKQYRNIFLHNQSIVHHLFLNTPNLVHVFFSVWQRWAACFCKSVCLPVIFLGKWFIFWTDRPIFNEITDFRIVFFSVFYISLRACANASFGPTLRKPPQNSLRKKTRWTSVFQIDKIGRWFCLN